MTTAGAADVVVTVFVAGGVVVLVGAADTVGTALVTVVVRRGVLVVAAVVVPAVGASSSSDGFGGAEVVVSDAVEFSSGEVTVVVGGIVRRPSTALVWSVRSGAVASLAGTATGSAGRNVPASASDNGSENSGGVQLGWLVPP
ncbi:hypothetical protein [Dietzia maris]|uniref:hypothetical protein n=1 Tax=Dietzia maris TaxID=37915 RepID=UPI00232B75FD|nr:hypothetical protein [Dietzia maris]